MKLLDFIEEIEDIAIDSITQKIESESSNIDDVPLAEKKQEYQHLAFVIEQLKQDHQSLSISYQILKTEYESLDITREALKQEHEGLSVAHKALKKDHQSLSDSCDALKQKYESLGTAHETLNQEHESRNTAYETLKREHQTLSSSHQTLKQDHQSLVKILDAFKLDAQKLRQSNLNLKQDNQNLGHSNDSFRQEQQNLVQHNSALKQEEQNLLQRKESLNQEYQRLMQEYQRISTRQAPPPTQTHQQQPPSHSQGSPALRPEPPKQIRTLEPQEKSLLDALSRSIDAAIGQFSLLPLAVPKGIQQALQASASSGIQLTETNRPTPDYYALRGHNHWLIIPNTNVMWPPLMLQQVGMEILFVLRPSKPTNPKKIKHVLAPAQMSRSGDNWSVVQQGILEFES